ncbi:MAG: Stk1 family PASTA domain-containing Ser/Thr kinase [Ruminococcus sp.]|nr:Stk1 family PASTA domain-containing Ser/Thr kinase [Ruminococcus sp.]
MDKNKNIGKKLDGRYEITELIGVGGMAEVYKGVDVIDNKTVAIKILKKEFSENEEFLRRFRTESKAIAVLSHPNIVKVYDVGFSDKIQYIVMEYIDGITLKEFIEQDKVLSWKDTLHFIIQILRALQHAHDKGIVHRDIKPQNIMMLFDGTIKVMDFGIAKFASEAGKTATDQAIGSVHYISPEQASGEPTDAKSDIYSVGAMMYEMLTGKKPFDSDNPVTIAVMHMHDIPERPRAINPDIPDGLEEIVLRAMEKNPEDRYQTTDEMISDLEKFKSNPELTFNYYQEEDDEGQSSTRFFDTSANIRAAQEAEAAQLQQQQPIYNGGAAYAGDPQQPYPPQQQGYGDIYNNDGYYEPDDDDEDEEEEEEERSSLVVPVLTAVVVVVIIVAVIFIATLLSGLLKNNNDKNDYTMPDFVGMDFNDAVSQYGNSIQFQEDGAEYNEYDAGIIISQDIPAGTEFKKGDILKVKISKGMETVEVPKLANMNQELAKDQLRQRGLECEVKNASSSEIEKGYVIRTEPSEGTEVHKGQTILLYVSMGLEAGQVSVDEYIGLNAEDAVALAEYKGLKPSTESVASYEDEGKVVGQSLEKGEKVDMGSEIVFQVSNGQNPDGQITYAVNFPAEASGRFVIDFMLKNEDGEVSTDTTPNIFCPEMSTISHDVKGSGEKVYVTVMLTNLSTSVRANIGTYYFNFAEGTITTETEDVWSAFDQVDGIPKATEAPTEEEQPQQQEEEPPQQQEEPQTYQPEEPEPVPTEAPTEYIYQPGINGEWDPVDGHWREYQPGINGYVDAVTGIWVWY